MLTSEIRKKLYPFAKAVFTRDSEKIYQAFLNSNTQPIENVMLENEYKTDQLVITLATLFHKEPYCIPKLIRSSDGAVIFTLFMRYHFLISALVEEPQDTDHFFLSDDVGFIAYVLNKLWVVLWNPPST